jgi:hypothetical protein
MGEKRNVYSFLVAKSEGIVPPGKLRPRWEYNIKVVLKELR